MSSALANSLALLGEIRNQLNQSKGNVLRHTSPTKPEKDLYKNSERKLKAVSHNFSAEKVRIIDFSNPLLRYPSDNKINSSAEFSNGLSAGKERYIEGKYSNTAYSNHHDLLNQIKTSFTPVPSGGDKFERKFSSEKRTKKNREKQGFTDLDNESIELKSSEMAEALKKSIQREIENFNNDCNDIVNKINSMIENISKENLSDDENEFSDEERKAKHGKKNFKTKEGSIDSLSHSIKNLNKKFEKLVEDIEDKKYKSNAVTSSKSAIGANPKESSYSNSNKKGKEGSKAAPSKGKHYERKDSFGERRVPSGEDSDF